MLLPRTDYWNDIVVVVDLKKPNNLISILVGNSGVGMFSQKGGF